MERRRSGSRIVIGLLALLAACSSFAAGHAGAEGNGAIMLATFRGPVTPVLAAYLDRTIGEAEANGAEAVIIELDTPGGSVDITKNITQRMARATVPVIVYVSPVGAHAGSAGTFITLGAHLAAMAPGSSIGAASPVGNGGEDLPATIKAKETNILVADIKNLAARRGDKAAEWAQRAVSDAAAATADEALQLGVIDAEAKDLPDLLRQLDGKQVNVAGKTVRLQLADRAIQPVGLSPVEDFLNTLANPAVAAILLTLGTTGLLLELSNPGTYLPGVAGAICLLLAFYALGVLQANWIGLAFIVLAFVLFVLDIKAPTHGVLTLGGIVSFVLGGFLLFNRPEMQVPWATLIVLALGTAAFFAFAIAKAVRAQRRRPATGIESLVGKAAVVRTALNPDGTVYVDGELWKATVDGEAIPAGQSVVITGFQGFQLRVRQYHEATDASRPHPA
jgi:membrane-bound serine protease (ClpP class)